MGSTRLPGKVMKDIKGKPVLAHVIERVIQSKLIEDIVVATTIHERDDIVKAIAIKLGVKFFRGSEDDVLSRYYCAAKEHNVDVVVRITSDCPLIDPKVVDEIVGFYLGKQYDLVTNAGSDLTQRTYPRGLDTEVFSFMVLEEAFNNAKEKYQREHVTPYIYETSKKVYWYRKDIDYSRYRWTLDTAEDFELIKRIYNRLYQGCHDFYLDDILDLFRQKPSLFMINAHIKQRDKG
jgi:spore coat polysaccharide biosynthesis protein SpsF